MFCIGNQKQPNAPLLMRCRKALWRHRATRHLQNIMSRMSSNPTFTVLDAPSAYGKTFVSHKFAEANKNKKVKILSCESVVDRLSVSKSSPQH